MFKLALPGGRLRNEAAAVLQRVGLEIGGYAEGSRSYRLAANGGEGITARVFREKDIPVQIALGNYDAGICGLAWTQEFLARHPQRQLAVLGSLALGDESMIVARAADGSTGLHDLAQRWGVRIASEYANLADAFALGLRLPGYRVLPVAGSAEAYPPEDAELAIIATSDPAKLRDFGLEAVHTLLSGPACLLVNRESLRARDLSPLLGRLTAELQLTRDISPSLPPQAAANVARRTAAATRSAVLRLALPDGHQHPHVVKALADAQLAIPGYTDTSAPVRRPDSPFDGVEVKLIRPQDMPQMVAAGFFDVAITGRDCILEHLYRFPDSPIEIAVDLQRSPVHMCAVVSGDLPATTLAEALAAWRTEPRRSIRIASEFTAIADHYARLNHFGRYQVIPTAGASEGFVPEDADLLIEGTETGKTLVENNLKSIEVLFLSTTCVIVRKGADTAKQPALERLLAHLQRAAEAASATIQARG